MKGSFQKKWKTAVSPPTIYRISQVQKNQTLESEIMSESLKREAAEQIHITVNIWKSYTCTGVKEMNIEAILVVKNTTELVLGITALGCWFKFCMGLNFFQALFQLWLQQCS